MYCPRCGETNVGSDRFCSACGQDLTTYRRLWRATSTPLRSPGVPQPPSTYQAPPTTQAVPAHAGPPPYQPTTTQQAPQHGFASPVVVAPSTPSYLGWAIALLVCCWPAWPAGVAAVVYAGRAEAGLAEGDAVGAWESSRKAKRWCWVTFGAGLVLWVVSLSLIVWLPR
jgi:hypothetical protein